jgi:FkbM family methyltransferase
MTPLISIRSYTTDQYHLDKVFYSNVYRLKKLSPENDKSVIVDIGAHCGYFSLAAMSAGYQKCYAFEPFSDNYKTFCKNTEVFSDSISSYQLALHHQRDFFKLSPPVLEESKFLDFGQLTQSRVEGETVLAVSIAEAFTDLIESKEIKTVKLNTGYPFDFITGNESAWSKVENFVFEGLYSNIEIKYIKEKLANLGFKDSLLIELKDKDKNFGFLGFFSKNNLSDVFDVEDLRKKNYEITD